MELKMIKSFMMILIMGIPIVSCAEIKSIEKPILKKDVLIFASGKQVVFSDDKPKKVYSESFKLLVDTEDKVAVVTRQQDLYEDASISVFAYSFNGDSLFSINDIFGSVYLLEDKNLLLVTRYSSHFVQKESEVVDYTGTIVSKLEPPAAVSFGGLSQDRKYVWLAAEILEMPISYEVFVYNFKGKKIAYGTSIPRDYNFQIDGDTYKWNLTGLSKQP